MVRVIVFLVLLVTGTVHAQMSEEQKAVKNTIVTFFDGFHKQDTTIIKSVVYNEVKLQTIGRNTDGLAKIKTDDFDEFITSIVSIPKENSFEEKLLSFNIQVDGDMANAWAEYEFWYNGTFSHCGVNSFQLFKDDSTWKIIYLVDTRRRKGCQE